MPERGQGPVHNPPKPRPCRGPRRGIVAQGTIGQRGGGNHDRQQTRLGPDAPDTAGFTRKRGGAVSISKPVDHRHPPADVIRRPCQQIRRPLRTVFRAQRA